MFLLCLSAMATIAAHAVFNRFAMMHDLIDPASYAIVHLFSGALVLSLVVLTTRRQDWQVLHKSRFISVSALLAFVLCLSFAVRSLGAGFAGLLVYGGLQLALFGGQLRSGAPVAVMNWLGLVSALAGVGWLAWPDEVFGIDVQAVLLLLAAGIGWGVFTLFGRSAGDPLGYLAANFALAAPVSLLALFAGHLHAKPAGFALACLSGVVTSGFGLGLWYKLRQTLKPATAGLAGLTFPLFAVYGGVLFLNELIHLPWVGAATLILFGATLMRAQAKDGVRPQSPADPPESPAG